MSALFHTYLLAKVRKHIDHSTECLTLFLDECDKSLDENQLSGLKALALYYRERSEEVQHIHHYYADRLTRQKGQQQ